MDRRAWLKASGFYAVATVGAGVGGGAQAASAAGTAAEAGAAPSSIDTLASRFVAGAAAFPQGVASGDPRPNSLVFWTRCVRGAAAAPSARGPIPVLLQVARDAGFRHLLAQVPLRAGPQADWTVRAKVTGLPCGTGLFYRFVAGGDCSPVGRTRTAPHATQMPTQLRFAWFTCQDWSVNHWQAMRLLADESLDFVVHVGDYIYETVGAAFQAGAAEPAHGPIRFPTGTALPDGTRYATTLDDYRTLYRTYRSDARLQAVHARFPFIATWDDHEFSDDAWQDHQTYTNANLQQTARRRAANQAWVEYMPIDFGDVAFDSANQAYANLRIYRDFRFGRLLHLVMTDERLYRDDHVVPEAAIAAAQGHDPVNGSDSVGARYFVQQPVLASFEAAKTAALGRAPSILGSTQAAWWKDVMTRTPATWKVWGNELMLGRLWLDLRQSAPPPFNALYVVNADSWDGFPSHKAELLGHLKQRGVRNVVAITGDLHAFQCSVVRDRPDPATGTPVLVDFVSAGISSSSFYSYLKAGSTGTPLAALTTAPAVLDQVLQANNPDLRYADHDAQGYASAVLTPTSLVVTFHKVRGLQADGQAPAASLLKRTRITLLEGSTEPIIEDDV